MNSTSQSSPFLWMIRLLILTLPPLLSHSAHAEPEMVAGAVMANPYTCPQPESAPDEMMALIEIPQGSINKYEIDTATGLIMLDRMVSMPVAYPANYGCFPRTKADDGDALDVLVLARAPIHPGVLVRVRPIGVLHMIDGGEQDDKIICVPVHKVDPAYDKILSLDDLPAMETERIQAFFRVYKKLPTNRKTVELKGFGDLSAAKNVLREALKLQQKEK